jgi:hypothetical protein
VVFCLKAFSHSFIHSFIHSSINGSIHSFILPWPLLQFRYLFYTDDGFLGRVSIPSKGRYIHTGEYKHRINAQTDIHALSEIRTHDPSLPATEHSSYLRRRGHCDRRLKALTYTIFKIYLPHSRLCNICS